MRYRLGLLSTMVGLTSLGFGVALDPPFAIAQTTNNITVPNNAESTANPQSSLDQQGSLVNTQVNTYPLGRSIVGNGLADCTTSGISASAFGSGVGPFDSGTLGGAVTYTHSFGMDTCKKYAKTQLGRAKLETCLLLISNYSKMLKSGIEISYADLMAVANVDCPTVTVRQPTFSSSQRQPDPNSEFRQAQVQPSLPVEQPSSAAQTAPKQPPQARVPSSQTSRAQLPTAHHPQNNSQPQSLSPQVPPSFLKTKPSPVRQSE
jgi:hypothetical protein